ncbi:hypothetical protein D3C71_1889220 [compost metagenome]
MHDNRGRLAAAGFLRLQVARQLLLLHRAEQQAEFAAPPEDVLQGDGPLLLAQIVHLAGVQAGAEVLAQIHQAVHVLQQLPGAGAVAACPAPGQIAGQPAVGIAQRLGQGAH